jgi:hypothetical protein
MDIIFKNKKFFLKFKEEGIITKKLISKLYNISQKDILSIIYFEPSYAVKITIKRWFPSGHPGERDIYGAQHHAPLLDIEYEE